ncbi:MAG TPA: RICIN domain-containing protein [Rhizomicrobium sp.]|jgi:hypothetical protein|nr:RICIN domain-containing protein [Rhizomicrobium sp.]
MRETLYIAVAVVALMLTGKPAAAEIPLVFYNGHTKMCLEPQNESAAQGIPVVQMPCKASGAQQWLFFSAASGTMQFQNAQTGLCLDARGGPTNHTPVQQWPCNGISNERWQLFAPAPGSVDAPLESRVSGSSGYCLDIPGGQVTAGLPMQIYGCNQTVSQLWQVNPAQSVYVPNVTNINDTSTLGTASTKLSLYGFIPTVHNIPNCFAGHTGFIQFPQGGSFAPPGSTVTLQVYTCTSHG